MAVNGFEIDVEVGYARNIETDLLVLKNMKNADGAGKEIARIMEIDFSNLPKIGKHKIFNKTHLSGIKSQNVLYIGTKPAPDFRYKEISQFMHHSLDIAAKELDRVEHITFTLHGPGYGLDEREAFESELWGLGEAFDKGPEKLRKVSFVEKNHARARRLRSILDSFPEKFDNIVGPGIQEPDSYGSERSHVFVAMPFDENFEDVYYLGIEEAVHSVNYLCERIDNEPFTGNIMDQIKDQIESASLLIADVTNENPNVYLEIGYAWGHDVPTLILSQNTDNLGFDVQSQKAVSYKRDKIRELREELENMLPGLFKP